MVLPLLTQGNDLLVFLQPRVAGGSNGCLGWAATDRAPRNRRVDRQGHDRPGTSRSNHTGRLLSAPHPGIIREAFSVPDGNGKPRRAGARARRFPSSRGRPNHSPATFSREQPAKANRRTARFRHRDGANSATEVASTPLESQCRCYAFAGAEARDSSGCHPPPSPLSACAPRPSSRSRAPTGRFGRWSSDSSPTLARSHLRSWNHASGCCSRGPSSVAATSRASRLPGTCIATVAGVPTCTGRGGKSPGCPVWSSPRRVG